MHEFVSGFFSRNLDESVVDASGWIFNRAGGTYFAVYPMMKYTWQEDDAKARRLSSPAGKAGFVVQVAQSSEFTSFDAFKAAIRALELKTSIQGQPTATFTTLRGKKIEATYGEVPKVNGVPVDFDAWPLFEGKFIEADKGSGKMLIKYGNMRHELDFNKLMKREWVEGWKD
jgi:hypothetical protein